jgi:multiple sugar transport system substrate-binding protein
MRGIRVLVAVFGIMAVVAVGCTNSPEADQGGGGATGDATGSDATGSSGERVTIDLWTFDEEDFLGSLESAFEAANPNIDLNVTAYPEENYGIKLDTAIAAGKEPDLTLYPGPDEIRAGLFLPIDDMLAEEGIDVSTYVPAIVDPGDELSCNWEGQLYCLGTFAGSVQMLYNKDLFDAAGIPYPAPWPPMTPDEFVDIACQLTDPENGVWGGAASDPLAYMPEDMFYSADGRTATGYVNGPEVVHQFDLLASGYERGCFPSPNAVDPWSQGKDYFSKGQIGMVITDFAGLKKVESAGINYGSTAPPTPDGVEPFFFVWTDSVGVMSSSEHPDEAMAFIAFLATDGQSIRYETTGDIPLDLAMADQVNWAKGIPGRQDGLEVLSHARPRLFIPNRGDVSENPYNDAWGFVLAGEKTAQEALDDAAEAIQENLDKAWEHWDEGG